MLYQRTNPVIQARASSIDLKGPSGNTGRRFIVEKFDSENGLSLLTLGRLNDVAAPRACRVGRSVAPFTGPPLSEWMTSCPGSTPSRSHAAARKREACSALSECSIVQPTTLRLQTSIAT